MNIKKTLNTGVIAIAITASMGAWASVDNNDVAIKVDVADINLATKEGKATLYQRLESAAKSVCGATSVQETGSLKRAMDNRACVAETLESALDSVDHAGLNKQPKTS